MTTTAIEKIKSVAVTAAGAGAGALVAGPVGLGVGLVAGAVVDMLRAKHKAAVPLPPVIAAAGVAAPAAADAFTAAAAAPVAATAPAPYAPAVSVPARPYVVSPIVAMAMTPGAAGLPPGTDRGAVDKLLMLLSLGHPKEAVVWLQKFQTSVGLPATGQPDAATQALLVLVDPRASAIPVGTVLVIPGATSPSKLTRK